MPFLQPVGRWLRWGFSHGGVQPCVSACGGLCALLRPSGDAATALQLHEGVVAEYADAINEFCPQYTGYVTAWLEAVAAEGGAAAGADPNAGLAGDRLQDGKGPGSAVVDLTEDLFGALCGLEVEDLAGAATSLGAVLVKVWACVRVPVCMRVAALTVGLPARARGCLAEACLRPVHCACVVVLGRWAPGTSKRWRRALLCGCLHRVPERVRAGRHSRHACRSGLCVFAVCARVRPAPHSPVITQVWSWCLLRLLSCTCACFPPCAVPCWILVRMRGRVPYPCQRTGRPWKPPCGNWRRPRWRG